MKMEEISDSAFESLILCTGWVQSTLCVIMCIFPFVKAAHWRYLLHVMTNAAERQRMVELGIFRFYGIAGPNQYLSSIGTVSALLFLLALHRMIRVKAFRAIELFKTVFLLCELCKEVTLKMSAAGKHIIFCREWSKSRNRLLV